MEIALKGNVTMLIWCGKQYLGQKDKTESAITTDKPITLSYRLDDDKQDGE